MEREVLEERVDTIKDLMEIVIGVPSNTALLKVTGLTMDESGEPKEFRGEFNLEQVLYSRAKFLQLTEKEGEDDTTVGERPAVGGDSGAESGAEENSGHGGEVVAGDTGVISGDGAEDRTGSDTEEETQGQTEEG